MQLDMFGATEATATREAAPPVIAGGAWVPPEALAFDAALRRGSLGDAIGILNQLKVNVAARVLLASGFAVGDTSNRAKMIAGVQSEIVAAARMRLTGSELRAVKSNGALNEEPHFPMEERTLPEKTPITPDIAAKMTRGMRVIDSQGKEYSAWSARFDYLETFPVGADGKPEVFAGNAVVFHLLGETSSAYPERRHEQVFLVDSLQVEHDLDSGENLLLNNDNHSQRPDNIETQEEIDHVGRSLQARELPNERGSADRGDGINRRVDRQPLDAGMAGASETAAAVRDVSGLSQDASRSGEGNPGELSGHEPSHTPGNPGVSDRHVVQSLGRSAVIYSKSDLPRVPAIGEDVLISFKDGKGAVEVTKDLGRHGAER